MHTISVRDINTPAAPSGAAGTGVNGNQAPGRKGKPVCRACGRPWHACQDGKPGECPSPVRHCLTCLSGERVILRFTASGAMRSECEACDDSGIWQEEDRRESEQARSRYAATWGNVA